MDIDGAIILLLLGFIAGVPTGMLIRDLMLHLRERKVSQPTSANEKSAKT